MRVSWLALQMTLSLYLPNIQLSCACIVQCVQEVPEVTTV